METIRAFRDDRLASGTFVSERPGRKVCLLHNGTLAQYNIQSLWYHSTTSLRKELKCILPERTALHREILRAWHHVLNPSIHPIHIFLQIEYHHHTEEINVDLQLQNCTILLNTALSIAA